MCMVANHLVMPVLDPGIHALVTGNAVRGKDVDGRDMPGHDDNRLFLGEHMRYAVVIEKAADNYSAYVPDLRAASPQRLQWRIRSN